MHQQQNMFQARVRQLNQESHRRKRAKEKRIKQRDQQEQQRREKVLQQRRQQLQEATERFQRSHLPSPDRRRETFRRKIPTIEEALSEIQNIWSSRRNCPSEEPPSVSKWSRCRDGRSSDRSSSASLSSKDSLEDEKPKSRRPRRSKSARATENLHFKPNNFLQSPGPATSTPVVRLSNNLNLSSKHQKSLPGSPQTTGKENRYFLKESNDCKNHFSRSLKLINTRWTQQSRLCPDEDEHKFPESVRTKLALAIKDSVELTKKKAKRESSLKTVLKKLRWDDEVNVEEKSGAGNRFFKHGRSRIPVRSPVYSLMKQADVGMPQGNEIKIPQCNWSGSPTRVQDPSVRSPCLVGPEHHKEATVGYRGAVKERRSVCVDHTPTDDEISALWLCVRSALASKDGAVGQQQPGVVAERRSSMSLEEQEILLSLERLDQKLLRVRGNAAAVGKHGAIEVPG